MPLIPLNTSFAMLSMDLSSNERSLRILLTSACSYSVSGLGLPKWLVDRIIFNLIVIDMRMGRKEFKTDTEAESRC